MRRIGDRAMTNSERQKRTRQKLRERQEVTEEAVQFVLRLRPGYVHAEALTALQRKLSALSPRCPVCGHVFNGNGWDGIDAHWKSKHESDMPYAEAWPLIKTGNYPRPGE